MSQSFLEPFTTLRALALPSHLRVPHVKVKYTRTLGVPVSSQMDYVRGVIDPEIVSLKHRNDIAQLNQQRREKQTRATHRQSNTPQRTDQQQRRSDGQEWKPAPAPALLKVVFNANYSKKWLALASQRNRLKRRWFGAFVQALHLSGYDARGRWRAVTQPMSGSDTSLDRNSDANAALAKDRSHARKRNKSQNRSSLIGTLEVILFNATGWASTPEKMLVEAQKLLAFLQMQQTPDKTTRGVDSSTSTKPLGQSIPKVSPRVHGQSMVERAGVVFDHSLRKAISR